MQQLSRLLCSPCRNAAFTPSLATQPELTAFVRALCVRRVESLHRERLVVACARALSSKARPKARPFLGRTKSRCGALALLLALWWPLHACPCSPVDDSGTDQHVRIAVRMLMCFVLYGSRVVRIAMLGQWVSCIGAEVPGGSRTELRCCVESEGDRWCNRNVLVHIFTWYQWF